MAYNQQLSVFGQVAPATTGTAGQVLVSAGSSASSYWASAIPVSAYSAQFNNSNYLSVANATALNLAGVSWTIECWVYPTGDTSTYRTIWSKRIANSGSASYQLYSNISTGYLTFYNGSTSYSSSTALTLNTWTHLATVYDGTNVNIYVNGTRLLQSATTITEQNTAFTIGTTSSNTNGSESYIGYISNLRITKGVAVYTGAFTTPTSPLGTSQAVGTNISAVSASQVSLLTCNGPGFTDSSPNAFTITNNGTVIASQFAPFSSFSAISRSATQTQTILTSGSGTYYTPSGVAWLRIRMVGGGGGGGGGSAGTTGSSGASTTFGSSFLNAGGGVNGINSNGPGGSGGTSSIGSGATGIALSGGSGEGGGYANYPKGGDGGVSAFGGAGKGGQQTASVDNGGAGVTNSGAGGGGGNLNNSSTVAAGAGSGGGSGGYVEAFISSPAASYAYTVGAGGAGGAGTATSGAGGGGGSGIIIVEENYAVNAFATQSNITQGTAVATTSGTSIDFTSIPSWVKRITFMLQGVSTNGSSIVQIQIGSGSFTTTGYLGTGFIAADASTPAVVNMSSGFLTSGFGAATYVRQGGITINNLTGNTWVAFGVVGQSESTRINMCGGLLALSGTLDRVRLTTVNGTDTFDAGSVNILYE